MTKTVTNKKSLAKRVMSNVQYGSTVVWHLAILGAQGLASYELYKLAEGLSTLIDYVNIAAATALAVSVVIRVAKLLSKEACNDDAE